MSYEEVNKSCIVETVSLVDDAANDTWLGRSSPSIISGRFRKSRVQIKLA